MFKTLKNAWSIPDLRKKLIFTAMILLVFRVGNVIPVPFVDVQQWGDYFESMFSGTILNLYDAMSGLSSGTIMSLGIQPYINASIIVQLLTIAIPALERMAKEEGEAGKKKINMITRISTIVLGLLMGAGAYLTLAGISFSFNHGFTPNDDNMMLTSRSWYVAVVVIASVTAGSAAVMWLGEKIDEKGIGNGISMILFAGIIAKLPNTFSSILSMGWWQGLVIVLLMVLLILFIVYINDAERRIPIQYAKRVVGRKIYGGQSTNMPIKVAMSGVMPIIFASSICSLPATVCAFNTNWQSGWFYDYIVSPTSVFYIVVYGLMIFFFSWFYSTIQYDPVEISNNLKNNGGFIPGFRPGKSTAEFIKRIISKLVVFGAVYLAVVALVPMILSAIGTNAYEAVEAGSKTAYNLAMQDFRSVSLGGTSIIILVGVALETVKALEVQMQMHHYKGFLD